MHPCLKPPPATDETRAGRLPRDQPAESKLGKKDWQGLSPCYSGHTFLSVSTVQAQNGAREVLVVTRVLPPLVLASAEGRLYGAGLIVENPNDVLTR